jgi:hypothetical protein
MGGTVLNRVDNALNIPSMKLYRELIIGGDDPNETLPDSLGISLKCKMKAYCASRLEYSLCLGGEHYTLHWSRVPQETFVCGGEEQMG